MIPGVTSPCIASHAPRPSIIDCRNRRSVREVTAKAPPRSEAATVPPSAAFRSVPALAMAAPRMPRPRTVSPPARTCSTKWAALAAASLASAWSRAVRAEFSSASASSMIPAATARAPSSQWKVNSTNRKAGVHGASKKANGPGPEAKRCIASRSCNPVAGAERAWGERPARVRIAPRTLGSMRAWNRAPARASTRALAWSSRPIMRNRKATMPISATSVASEREVSTRS